ncbi:MAG: pyruvate dehydrogenase complex E1 component subunit beta [Deltaproteobacteria bacterium]|nr:pyruvate dehydrogenase complex E1 component subunit beta [Deltaproteobacteria bacterium]
MLKKITYREALNEALVEEMERDPAVVLIGEEVGQYDGAYKVSQGLLKKFGEKRVIDTPITEAGFAGLGIGAAMGGLRPVVEMMTFNFALLALDQIVNGAAKMRYMSGGQVKVPCVIRGPGGAAHQLAAQHSQCFESTFASVPGLKVVMPSTSRDAKGLLKSAIRDDNPVIFIEGEILYGSVGDVPEGEYLIPIGVGDIKREGSDVTIIAHSKMVYVALTAAKRLEEFGISAEVLDLRTIRPLDEELIVQSVRKTHRCVIVEEGWHFYGVGAQVADVIYNHIFDELDAPIRRVTGLDVPMPYSKPLEHQVIPDAHRVIDAVRDVLYMKG